MKHYGNESSNVNASSGSVVLRFVYFLVSADLLCVNFLLTKMMNITFVIWVFRWYGRPAARSDVATIFVQQLQVLLSLMPTTSSVTMDRR